MPKGKAKNGLRKDVIEIFREVRKRRLEGLLDIT